MIKSMTGYGRNVFAGNNRRYTVEIKTVNHRYNDISIKMPRYLIALEDKLRQLISQNISRGKVDVFINIENLDINSKNVKIDEALAGSYIQEMRSLIEKYDLANDISATSVLKLPDVITASNDIDVDEYWDELKSSTEEAIDVLNFARIKEGNRLKEDLLNRLDTISNNVKVMSDRSSGLVEEYRKKLEARLEELHARDIIDENRLGAELVMFADKSSICEEITRLNSHITSFKNFLNSDDDIPCGKKLDFLLQEMNREINTIGSKANCIDITNVVVDTKNEIENIREQVQNIE